MGSLVETQGPTCSCPSGSGVRDKRQTRQLQLDGLEKDLQWQSEEALSRVGEECGVWSFKKSANEGVVFVSWVFGLVLCVVT